MINKLPFKLGHFNLKGRFSSEISITLWAIKILSLKSFPSLFITCIAWLFLGDKISETDKIGVNVKATAPKELKISSLKFLK